VTVETHVPGEQPSGAKPAEPVRAVMVEVSFGGLRGHAFAAEPEPFQGTLRELLALSLGSEGQRALLLAAENAIQKLLGEPGAPPEDVTLCAEEIAESVGHEFGQVCVGMLGYRPELVRACVALFGAERVRVADSTPDYVGRSWEGVTVEEAMTGMDDLFAWADVVIVTGQDGDQSHIAELLELADRHGPALVAYDPTGVGRAYFEGRRRNGRANSSCEATDASD